MPNPEQGPEEQGVLGTWQTISLEVPDFLEPVREAIDAFFSFLIQILNILIAVLEILKVFASGLLDPLITFIEAIRDLIEALLNDLRQLGIYIHGDFYLLDGPDFAALKGGYLNYEARMVARLTDTSDPNRPDISSFSTCLAVFLYVSADIRGINRILQLIKAILALFRRKFPGRLQNQVTNIQATYGYDGATIFSFNKGFFRAFKLKKENFEDNVAEPYNAVNLTWQMAPIPGQDIPSNPIMAPAGFLVEFSTLEQPLKVVCERVIEGSAQDMELQNQPAKTEVVDCLDEEGNPILIRGGAEALKLEGQVDWNDAVNVQGEFKTGAVRAYAIRNLSTNSPIQLSDLQEGDRHYLQRTFFVPFAQNLFFPGKGYGATFEFKDMPYAAEWELNTTPFSVNRGKLRRTNDTVQPERYFVRIRAVSSVIKDEDDYQFLVNATTLGDRDGPVLPIAKSDEMDLNDAGPPSFVVPILFPDASTQLYLQAVGEALAILALSRADLPVLLGKEGPVDFPAATTQILADGLYEPFWEGYQDRARLPTGLEEIAQFLMVRLIGRRQIKKFFNEADASVPKFRRKLFINCINLTNRMLSQNLPPLPARQLVVERAEDLLNFQILRSLTDSIITTVDPNFPSSGLEGGSPIELCQSDDLVFGLGPNPLSLAIGDSRAADSIPVLTSDRTILPRSPHFFFAEQGTTRRGRGSADMSPVVYSREGTRLRDIDFFRNLVPDSVYEGAQFALQVAVGPQVRPKERGWIAFRVFPQGIPSIDRFFDQILALLRAVQAAIESIAETIRRYIEFLQSRLRELQTFLNRLNALIQRLLRFFFSITPAAGLIVVAPGTDGVTTALLTAQNKPLEPANPQADSYAGGIVLFAGGIPNLAIDIFRALFKGEDVGEAAGGALPPLEFPSPGEAFGNTAEEFKKIKEARQELAQAGEELVEGEEP